MSAPEPAPVGYLVGSYPAPSHTFILREVRELRRLGLTVRTFSVRRSPPEKLLSPADREEAATTESLLPVGAGALLRAHAALWCRHPGAWLATVAEALRVAPPGPRAKLWQLFYVTEAVLLADRCRQAGIRQLHAHLANVAADVAWLATRLGQRCEPEAGWRWSFTMHGPTELSEVERFNLRRKVHAADVVVCISEFCRSQLMRLVGPDEWGKLHVVHCGVDLEEFSFVDRRSRAGRPVTVLTIGRLVADKGQAVLVEAAALVSAAGGELRFVVAGEGPERESLDALRRRLGVEASVALVGPVGQDGLVALYEEADIFCLPSFAEGLPVVLMEAMACGLPVVTTPIAGIPELVGHERTGLLVAPGRPDLLAAALGRLSRDHQLRHQLGEQGRRAVEAGFDLHRNARLLEGVHRGAARRATWRPL